MLSHHIMPQLQMWILEAFGSFLSIAFTPALYNYIVYFMFFLYRPTTIANFFFDLLATSLYCKNEKSGFCTRVLVPSWKSLSNWTREKVSDGVTRSHCHSQEVSHEQFCELLVEK
jgi:hypothetical protein